MRYGQARAHELKWRRSVISSNVVYVPRRLRGMDRMLLILAIAMVVTLIDMACVSGFGMAAWHVAQHEWTEAFR